MPRSAKQNEEMRAATRAAILHSAMKLFAQNGYNNTTTRSIAQDADISTGLMYHYFVNKEALLRAVFDHCMTVLGDLCTAAYTESTPQERVANLLRAMFDLLEREQAFWSLFYTLRWQPAIMYLLEDEFRLYTERLRDLFAVEFQQAGRAEPTMDAFLLYSLLEGTIQQYLLDPDHYPLDEVVARIIAQYGEGNSQAGGD